MSSIHLDHSGPGVRRGLRSGQGRSRLAPVCWRQFACCNSATFPVTLKRNAAPACANPFGARQNGANLAQFWRRQLSNPKHCNALNSMVSAAQKLARFGANTKTCRAPPLCIPRIQWRGAVSARRSRGARHRRNRKAGEVLAIAERNAAFNADRQWFKSRPDRVLS